MNPWDVVTWLAAVALALSAVVIFGFFLRDARSIFDREMHDRNEDEVRNKRENDGKAEAKNHQTQRLL